MVRIDTAVCGSMYFHQMTFTAAGDLVPTHRHTYDHVLQVQRGRVRIWTEGERHEELVAPAVKAIPSGIAHDLEALEPGTVACCVHVLRDEHDRAYPFSYELTTRDVCLATARL